MIDEATYNALVAEVLKRMLKALDAADPDALDADSTGEMLTVTGNASGQKVVVNTQRAVHQLWVAGKGSGIHFSWDAASGRWLDDKGKGLELYAWVAECVEAASGEKIRF
jgi:CyaY protein